MNLANLPTSRSAAKARGSTRYFTGKPCPYGHIAPRGTGNGECVACAEARRADPANREKFNETGRLNYTLNREKILEKQRLAKQQDPERFRRNQATYCQRNPEKRKDSQNRYYARNRGQYLAYGRMRDLGVKQATPAWADKEAIEAVYLEAKRLEEVTGEAHHVDHVVPLKGVSQEGEHIVCGLHVQGNLLPIPARVNRAKSNRFEAEQYEFS